jgi:hypothetical protein
MDTLVIGGSSSSTDFIAVLALLVSIVSVIATVILSRRQEKRGYMDEFWFREIFAPSCVTPIIDFRAKWEQRLAAVGDASINQKKGKELVNEIGSDCAALLQKVWVAKLFEGDFYAFCEEELDQMEDEFAQVLGAAQLRSGKVKGVTAPTITEGITVVCARILQRAASIHGQGLRISG